MGQNNDRGSEAELTSLLASALDQYSDARRRLQHLIGGLSLLQILETGEVPGERDLKKLIAELRSAQAAVIAEEIRRGEELRKQTAGFTAGTYDLDHAKHEIGERLARLRAAGQDEGLP